MAQPQGYAKARRVFALADRLGFPVVTMIDTPGAYPGVEAEQDGQAARSRGRMLEMARLRVPTVACVIGEGGSGGALAIAVADRVLMQEHAIYSVISPEGCADDPLARRQRGKKAAAAFKPDALQLRARRVDGVVPEPSGGAHKDHDGPPACWAALAGARRARGRAGRAAPRAGARSSAAWASTPDV